MIREGSVPHNQMPDISERTARGLSYMDLLAEISPNSQRHLLFSAELRRREGRAARLAISISFLSLVVSFVAVLVKV